MRKSGFFGGIILAVILVVAVIVLSMLTCKVPAGYVAVQYNMNGGVKEEVLTQGWHLIPPTVHTTLYTVGIEQSYLTAGKQGDSERDESFTASSSEGKAIKIDLTFTYQYNPHMVTSVFTQFKGQSGKEVRDSFIKPNVISAVKEVIAQYGVSDILGAERANINIALTDYIAGKFVIYGINISNVSLINVEVDEDTMKVISEKIAAQQNAEKMAIENQIAIDKANAEKKVKITQQEAEAEALIIESNAKAQAILVEAEAKAEANRLLAESLNADIIKSEWVKVWDGKLPTYMLSDSNSLIIDLSE